MEEKLFNESWYGDRFVYEEIVGGRNRLQLVANFVEYVIGVSDGTSAEYAWPGAGDWEYRKLYVPDAERLKNAIELAKKISDVLDWDKAGEYLKTLGSNCYVHSEECGDAVVRSFVDVYGVCYSLLQKEGVVKPPSWANDEL